MAGSWSAFAGRVSSWNSRAVSGSADYANWSFMEPKRAVLSVVAPWARMGLLNQRMRGDLVGDHRPDVLAVRQTLRCSWGDVAQHRGTGLSDMPHRSPR